MRIGGRGGVPCVIGFFNVVESTTVPSQVLPSRNQYVFFVKKKETHVQKSDNETKQQLEHNNTTDHQKK